MFEAFATLVFCVSVVAVLWFVLTLAELFIFGTLTILNSVLSVIRYVVTNTGKKQNKEENYDE